MNKSLVACVLGSALLLNGCETVNTTSAGEVGVVRQQKMFTLLSSEQVNQAYAQDYQQTLGDASNKNILDKTSADAKRVQAVADRLIAQACNVSPGFCAMEVGGQPHQADDLNANCGPGGRIVYTGLIDKLQLTDDELAAVMGHEIATLCANTAVKRCPRPIP